VIRKTLILLIACAGLLGAAEPLLACMAPADVDNCCPSSSSPLCDASSEPALPPAVALWCCVSPPSPVTTAVAVAKRTGEQSHNSDANGDPGVVVAPACGAFRPPASPLPSAVISSSLTSEFGTQTYLRTARLRL